MENGSLGPAAEVSLLRVSAAHHHSASIVSVIFKRS
jgi:hypothetical protein